MKKKTAECVQHTGESYTSYIEDVLALFRGVYGSMADNDRVRRLLKCIVTVAYDALVVKSPTIVADAIARCQRLNELHSIRLQPDVAGHGASNDNKLRALIRTIIREELHAQHSSRAFNGHTTPPGGGLPNIVREELHLQCGVRARPKPSAPTQHLNHLQGNG